MAKENRRTHRTRRLIPVCLALLMLSPASAQDQEHPNILFVFLDDFGWRDCGFMGSDYYETPNLDRLAGQAMVFSNAYATAANCAPSRACLLSGQYTPRHEVFNVGTRLRGNPKFSKLKHIPGTKTLRADVTTWAHCAQNAGYATGTIGKWHLSDDPIPYGFDSNIAGSHSGGPPKGYFPPHPGAPGLKNAPPQQYLTDRLNDEAIRFIETHQHRPWLLYLTHFAVHTPLQAKPALIEKFQGKPKGKLHGSAVMGAMIQSVDEGVGRLIAKLDELGLTDKTAIVFTSDNGGYGPATDMRPLKGYKGTYYEGGIREPFFVKWPGVVEPGTECDVPIINVDLFPTLCAMTGAELPSDQTLDGQTLMPLLTGTGDFADRALYWHFPAYLQGYSRTDQQRDPIFRTRPCSIIRRGDWKLHEYFEGGVELYNLRDDIGEQDDLSLKQPAKTRELHSQLITWRKRIGAPVPTVPNPRYDPAAEAAELKRLTP